MKRLAGKQAKGRRGSKTPKARTVVVDVVFLRSQQGKRTAAAFARWLRIPPTTYSTIMHDGTTSWATAWKMATRMRMNQKIDKLVIGAVPLKPKAQR